MAGDGVQTPHHALRDPGLGQRQRLIDDEERIGRVGCGPVATWHFRVQVHLAQRQPAPFKRAQECRTPPRGAPYHPVGTWPGRRAAAQLGGVAQVVVKVGEVEVVDHQVRVIARAQVAK